MLSNIVKTLDRTATKNFTFSKIIFTYITLATTFETAAGSVSWDKTYGRLD